MTTHQPTFERPDDYSLQIFWVLMGAGDDGAPVEVSAFPTMCFSLTGNTDSHSVLIQGTNDDGGCWGPLLEIDWPAKAMGNRLHDPLIDASNMPRPRWIRPVVLGAGTTSDCSVVLFCQRPFGPRP